MGRGRSCGCGAWVVFVLWALLCVQKLGSVVEAQNNSYSDKDLYAMGQLWSAWGGSTPDPQENLAGWNDLVSTNPPCAQTSPWRGVFCNAKTSGSNVWAFEIMGLTLRNSSIVGSLPAAIGNLTNLVTLTLTDNPGLGGALPEELGQLLSLFDLDLHGNSFTGIIPKFFYDAFGFLQSIDLSDNKLTGELPHNNTVSYRTIQTLNLSSNQFSGLVPSNFLMYLQNMVSADMSHNALVGAMPVMVSSNETKLLDLDFSDNHFNGTLPQMTGHRTIRFFNASGNQLSGLLNTSQLSNIPTLKTLDLSRNQFTGAIPDLSLLASIEFADLSYNNFAPGPFPVWTNALTNLHTLLLRGVYMTGAVPSSVLVGFLSLQTLVLDDNNFTGTLDIDRILAVANRSPHLQLISLVNNKISNVAYSDSIYNLNVQFNLSGNPFCDLRVNSNDDDLRRCVCQQQCFVTGHAGSNKKVIIISTVVSGFVCACVILIYSVLFYQSRRERVKLIFEANQKFDEYEVKPTIYSFGEIRAATGDFHLDMKLGKGHYGAVYKGTLANGTQVAVKQLFSKSQQSLDVFLNEIVLVAAVKHRNLVKLKGCCIRKDQRLLVHEYVELGDLEQILFDHTRNVSLTWPVRRNIWIGVANGIHYLHSLAQPKIIHRDIKASNILLDKNLEPKIADFGLALLFPDDQSHVMTIHVAGTRGYLAPEYATLGQLSEKVDVYSFGILLLEIVSGRRNIDPKLPSNEIYLVEWIWTLREEDRMKQLLDSRLTLQIDEEIEMLRILDIAFMCVQTSAERRPSMARVVAMLQGDMDFESTELSRFREASYVDSHRDGTAAAASLFSSTDSIVTLPSSSRELYRNSPVFIGTTPSASRESLLSSVSRVVELPDR